MTRERSTYALLSEKGEWEPTPCNLKGRVGAIPSNSAVLRRACCSASARASPNPRSSEFVRSKLIHEAQQAALIRMTPLPTTGRRVWHCGDLTAKPESTLRGKPFAYYQNLLWYVEAQSETPGKECSLVYLRQHPARQWISRHAGQPEAGRPYFGIELGRICS